MAYSYSYILAFFKGWYLLKTARLSLIVYAGAAAIKKSMRCWNGMAEHFHIHFHFLSSSLFVYGIILSMLTCKTYLFTFGSRGYIIFFFRHCLGKSFIWDFICWIFFWFTYLYLERENMTDNTVGIIIDAISTGIGTEFLIPVESPILNLAGN